MLRHALRFSNKVGAADHKEHSLDGRALGESPTGIHSREKRRAGNRNSKKYNFFQFCNRFNYTLIYKTITFYRVNQLFSSPVQTISLLFILNTDQLLGDTIRKVYFSVLCI